MKPSFLIHAALAVMALGSTAMAQDKPPTDAEVASKAQTDAYVAAFNKGDAKALAALYAEDAEYSSAEGDSVTGRAAVLEGLTKFFSKNKGAQLDVQVESARLLTPDVLVEKGLSTINGEETTRYVCSYVKKDGAWLISELTEAALLPAEAGVQALEELAWMEGSWKDNTANMTVVTNVDWVGNGHFLRRAISVTRGDADPIEATEIIGYDPVAGAIRSWMFDSEGGFGEGTWSRDANKWLVSFAGTGPDGTKSSAQHIITLLDENKYTWESVNREREGQVLPNLDKAEVVRDSAAQ